MSKAIFALMIAMVFIIGCDHEADHDHDEVGHESEAKQIDHNEQESYTLYTGNLELFVEFDPIVVGETSTFIVHFTQLNQDYSPLANAEVNLTLEIEGKHTQLFKSHADIPGIYLVEVSSDFSGQGKIIFQINKEGFSDRFVLEDIHVFNKTDEIHAHNQQTSGKLTYLKEQAWNTEFNVEPVSLISFSKVINASGEIMAMPGEKQNLIAKNNGIVLFSTRNLVQGSLVNKGDLLFTISGKGFTDNNISVKYHEARLQFEKSKNQYLRHKNLVTDKIVSEGQFAESKNRYLADSIAYYNFEQTVSDGGLKVYAPFTGYIHELNVSEGQYAATGSVLATISSNKVMLLRADVSQQHFANLGEINDATFRPAYAKHVYTIKELNGKLLAKASSVAENNHYMPVYFEVINDGSLLEGAFAEFHLKTKPQLGTLVVPVGAVVEEQNNFYVYLQVSGEGYLKKQLELGDSDGIYTEVLSGLSEGDRVVTKGAMLIKAASISSEPVHSHSH